MHINEDGEKHNNETEIISYVSVAREEREPLRVIITENSQEQAAS